jgi:hypothetical protein
LNYILNELILYEKEKVKKLLDRRAQKNFSKPSLLGLRARHGLKIRNGIGNLSGGGLGYDR